MIKRREFAKKYTLGKTKFKQIKSVQSLLTPCTSPAIALGLIGWWQVGICDHLSCQNAVSFFNAIFLTNSHFSVGFGSRQTALIAVTE